MDVLGLLVDDDAQRHRQGRLQPAEEQEHRQPNEKAAGCLKHIFLSFSLFPIFNIEHFYLC